MKPIRTNDDLLVAHERVASLIRANRSGQNDDEIAVLATLIEHYERTNFDVDPPDPISAIKFRMAEMGLGQRQLEPFIGSRARVFEVLSGKRSLSMDMIRSLHDGLGIPYASLIGKRQRSSEDKLDVATAALARLNALGFDVDESSVSSFLHSSLHTSEAPALLRKTRSARAASKTDQSALILWQAAVLRKAKDSRLRKFDPTFLDDARLRTIARLSMKPTGPALAVESLTNAGIHVVFMPPLPGTFLDGAAMIAKSGAPIVAMTLRYDRVDNFWFTLLHELAHVRLHRDKLFQKDFVFFDDMDVHSEDVFEREADDLAQRCLIPDLILKSVRWDARSSIDDIIAVASRARVHQAIVAGRWQRDHQNYRRFARLIERDTLRVMLTSRAK